jgi:hypothetical protein
MTPPATIFLPLISDAPGCNMPAPGDGLDEPIIVQLRTVDGQDIVVPLSLAAAQALAQLLLRGDAEELPQSLQACAGEARTRLAG